MGSVTGTMKLWENLRFVASPTVEVMPITWRANVWELAEHIWLTGGTWDEIIFDQNSRIKAYQPFPRVYIYAYSWGAGWCATHLMQELRRRGLAVEIAIFCDPVYRSPYMPAWLPFNPSSMLGKWPIWIPDNVKIVKGFYQTEKQPWAHPVRAMDAELTTIETFARLHGVEHQYMDDHPRYHQLAVETAKASLE